MCLGIWLFYLASWSYSWLPTWSPPRMCLQRSQKGRYCCSSAGINHNWRDKGSLKYILGQIYIGMVIETATLSAKFTDRQRHSNGRISVSISRPRQVSAGSWIMLMVGWSQELWLLSWYVVCLDEWVLLYTDMRGAQGPSGAGKTSLLDVLATRNTVGVVCGEAFVDGCLRDISFQRKTGYIQQQDFHLATSTVREALQFSAIMRQPSKITRKEKLDYVEGIIKLLDMDVYADAIVGVPGEGLWRGYALGWNS